MIYPRGETDRYLNFLESPGGKPFFSWYWLHHQPSNSTAVRDDTNRHWIFHKWMNDVTLSCMNEEMKREGIIPKRFKDSRPIAQRLHYLKLPILIDDRVIFKLHLDNFILQLTGNTALAGCYFPLDMIVEDNDMNRRTLGAYILYIRNFTQNHTMSGPNIDGDGIRHNAGPGVSNGAGTAASAHHSETPRMEFSARGLNNDMTTIQRHDHPQLESHQVLGSSQLMDNSFELLPLPNVVQSRPRDVGSGSSLASVLVSTSSNSALINDWHKAVVKGASGQASDGERLPTMADGHPMLSNEKPLRPIPKNKVTEHSASIRRDSTPQLSGNRADKLPLRMTPPSAQATVGILASSPSDQDAGSSTYTSPSYLPETKDSNAVSHINLQKPLPPLPVPSGTYPIINHTEPASWAQRSHFSVPSLISDHSSMPTTGYPSIRSSMSQSSTEEVAGMSLLKKFVEFGQKEWGG